MTGHESDAHTPAPPPGAPVPFAGRRFPRDVGMVATARVHELELELDDLRRAVEEERAAAEVLRERLEQQDERIATVHESLEVAVARTVRLGGELMSLWARALNGEVHVTAGELRRALVVAWSGGPAAEDRR